ncbi:MAG TPA: DUF3391 domain-containing protein [Burkholderiaceae bacterium]|nr:DUF3391 domain-containing protein [Burkholderiaceae bacterium]
MDGTSAKIAVDQLRVGVFVHLDLGWWAHPFALSSFKLTSHDQIATLRQLGLAHVRWSPDKSTLDDATEASVADNDTRVAAPTQQPVGEAPAEAAPVAGAGSVASAAATPILASNAAARRRQRRPLWGSTVCARTRQRRRSDAAS